MFHLKPACTLKCFISTVNRALSLLLLLVKLPCFGHFKCMLSCKCVFICFPESGATKGYKKSTRKYKCDFKPEKPLAVIVR